MTLSGIPVPGVIRVSTVNQGGLSTRVLTDSPTVALDGLMPETTYRIECLDSSDVPILQTTTRTPTVWRMVEPRSYWKESTLYMSFYVHRPQPIPPYRVILRESTSAVPQIVFERRSPDRSDTEELGETESGAPGAALFQFEHLCQHTQRSHHLSMDLEAGWGQVRDLRIPPPELNTRNMTLINDPKTDLGRAQAVGLAASAAMTIAEQLRLPLTIVPLRSRNFSWVD